MSRWERALDQGSRSSTSSFSRAGKSSVRPPEAILAEQGKFGRCSPHWILLAGTPSVLSQWERTSLFISRLVGKVVFRSIQFVALLDTPIFLLFDPTPSAVSQTLPFKVYEAALAEGGDESEAEGMFVELEYGIETGEAERIAVDGVSRGGIEGDDSSGKYWQ